MKEILAAVAVLGGFGSLWFAIYWMMTVDEPSKGKRHAVALVIALIGGTLLGWLVAPAEGATEMGWGWVLLALLITFFLFAMAVAAPQSARDVVTQVAGPGKHKAKPVNATRAIRTGWSQGEIAFTYEDADGEVTYRTVTVHAVTATHIKGECHDRQAERTFRLDRVIGDITDTDTGEMLKPKKWAQAYR
ncbi:MAG: hypothetical protein K2Y24_00910 [Pseudomonadaceae bacterium]|nr:hypothetical protein [Pseudomonadaceae bacterium]